MSAAQPHLDFEPVIWSRLLSAQQEGPMPVEVAKYLLSVSFGENDRARLAELAERASAGILTDEERAEYDSYLHIGGLLAVMQSKARVALSKAPLSGSSGLRV